MSLADFLTSLLGYKIDYSQTRALPIAFIGITCVVAFFSHINRNIIAIGFEQKMRAIGLPCGLAFAFLVIGFVIDYYVLGKKIFVKIEEETKKRN